MANPERFALRAEELKNLLETVQRNDLRLKQLNEESRVANNLLTKSRAASGLPNPKALPS